MSFLQSIPDSIKSDMYFVCVLGWAAAAILSIIILFIAFLLCLGRRRWATAYTLSKMGKWAGIVAIAFAFNAILFASIGGYVYGDDQEFYRWLLVAVATVILPLGGFGAQFWAHRTLKRIDQN